MGKKISSFDFHGSELEGAAVEYLRREGLKVAFAESCTGGLASKRIVDVPGASSVFLGSIVSYSNEVKMKLLGVSDDTLEKFGAVSEQTAREMAEGVVLATGADIGVSITGIAGPQSDDTNKPIGLVYIGVSRGGKIRVKRLDLAGYDRQTVRYLSASHAIYSIFEDQA